MGERYRPLSVARLNANGDGERVIAKRALQGVSRMSWHLKGSRTDM